MLCARMIFKECYTSLFQQQLFHKQRQAQIDKKSGECTLNMKFCYLKLIHILHSRYHPKIKISILKNKQQNKRVCIHEIMRLITMKIKMKMKNKSHRYGINIPRFRHGHKYSK